MNQEDLTAALRAKAFNSRKKHVFEFLDLGTGPLICYMRPFSIGDQHKYGRRIEEQNDVSAILELFIDKAENEQGEKLFDKSMVQVFLDTLEVSVIATLAEAIVGVPQELAKEAEGNSDGTSSGEPSLRLATE